MTLRGLLVVIHIATGMLALCAFWTAALARKGDSVHRRAGRGYVWLLGVSLGSAVPLLALMLARGERGAAMLLGYVGFITAGALWSGVRALAAKERPERLVTRGYVILSLATFAAGLAALAAGLTGVGPRLMIWLSFIGTIGGTGMLRFAIARTHHRRAWLGEHISAMIGTGIASHIAFALFGARGIMPNSTTWSMAAWLAPLIVGILATRRSVARYASPALLVVAF